MRDIPLPSGPTTPTRDAWGYPSVRVQDRLEGAFARGFMHATDRFLQVQLGLAVARGRLMEIAGDTALSRAMDYATRALGFARDLDAQVAAIPTDARPFIDAYCEGFRAGARARRGRPRSSELLLGAAGLTPEEFGPHAVVLLYRLYGLFGLASAELVASLVAAELLAHGVRPEALTGLYGDVARDAEPADLARVVPPEVSMLALGMQNGSNAFAIRSARGALLASEFHMQIGRFPPGLYAWHESYADGDFLSGMSLPGLAWLSAGRTRRVAWTYTYAHGSAIDLGIERCDRGAARASDGTLALTRRVERPRVRGRREPLTWTFADGAFGTVLGDAAIAGDYLAVRWSGLDRVGADIGTCARIATTTSVRELAELHRELRACSLQLVAADREGAIATVQTGQIDQRPAGWRGVVPRRMWDLPIAARRPAPVSEESRMVEIDPPRGFVVAANAEIAAPIGETWTRTPETRYRGERIAELLARGAGDLEALRDISYDDADRSALRLVPRWAPHVPDAQARRALLAWIERGAHVREGSELALFIALHGELVREAIAMLCGERAAARLVDALMLTSFFEHHLDDVLALERPALLDEPALASAIARAWPRAVSRAKSTTHPVPMRVAFEHAVLTGPLFRALGFGTAPRPIPGGPSSPFQTRWVRFGETTLAGGPAFHMYFDMSADTAVYNLPGGASESRFGPGYGLGVDAFASGELAPLGPR